MSGGFTDPQQLLDDIAAARSAGVSPGRIAIFSLDGMLEVGNPAAWTVVPEPTEFEQSPSTGTIRRAFEFLDATHTP